MTDLQVLTNIIQFLAVVILLIKINKNTTK